MIQLLPEPKEVKEYGSETVPFSGITLKDFDGMALNTDLVELAKERFWNYQDINISTDDSENSLTVFLQNSLPVLQSDKQEVFHDQGYELDIRNDQVVISYETKIGYINAVTSLKQLLDEKNGSYILPTCHITDYPSLPVRAIAQTFAWYAGYGRIGFDSQLWGYKEWKEYLNICLDNKINQFNLVMYGYWPFEMV